MTRTMFAAVVGVWTAMTLMSVSPTVRAETFGEDLAFLNKHTQIVVLADDSGQAQVAVAPQYQGRVLTSTAGGAAGMSYGWINRELIASGEQRPHMNAFGGEDRFWLGPEGGQFAIFFQPGAKFTLDDWQTPAAIDTDAWPIVRQSKSEVAFRRKIKLTNYSGTRLELQAERIVRLVPRDKLAELLGVAVGTDVSLVAYESENRITNTGSEPWTKEGGLLSIWILGMYQPSDQTTVVVPFRPGPESELGPKVNDAYFGKVPADRLKVGDQHLFFRGDGRSRGKIGVGPKRVKPILGSYAADSQLLTLVQLTVPPQATGYVNSMWEIQKEPFAGDVVNSYNDGPPAPGAKPLGPFYELESSSPAAALAPGQSLTHVHRTIHLQGPASQLSPVAEATLGVSVTAIQTSLGAVK
jgi:hypothetical protein